MPSFDSPAALHNEAMALYREGKDSAAALTWARAREAARTFGDQAAAWQAGVWEADSWRHAGDVRRSLGLFLSLLSDIPPDAPAYERWMAHKKVFTIQLQLRPERTRLQRVLAEMDTLATKHAHPPNDPHYCRGDLAFGRGAWDEALGHVARGWQATEVEYTGHIKSHFAWRAVQCSLRLGQREDAEIWRDRLTMTDQDEWEDARQRLKAATFLLALEVRDDAGIEMCVNSGCGGDHYELRGQLFLRGASLDGLHDPGDLSHPTRKLAVLKRTQDVHKRYTCVLGLVDYRLACLRFTAGLPAADDLYYRRPDVIPKRLKLAEPAKFQRQLRGFLLTWHLLLRHAKRIDTLLECDWRTQEATARRKRAESIAAAAGIFVEPKTRAIGPRRKSPV